MRAKKIKVFGRFDSLLGLLDPGDESSTILRNVGNHLPVDVACS